MRALYILCLAAVGLVACDDEKTPVEDAPKEPEAPWTAEINPAVAYEHPAGVFTAAVPEGWIALDNPQPGPFGTLRLSKEPDLIVSSVRIPSGVEPKLEEHMKSFFDKETPIGEAQSEEIDGGLAMHRMYGDDTRTPAWRWWIRVLLRENQLVTITVSDSAERFDQAKDAYLAVIQEVVVPDVEELGDDALPNAHTDKDIERVQERTPGMFWGHAKDKTGIIKPFPPKTTKETRLVDGEEATAVVQEAVDVGLAQWCGLPWKPMYFAHQDARRAAGWEGRKVAYAGTLFGSSQDRIIERMLADIGDCTEAYRRVVERRVEERMKRFSEPAD